MLGELNDGEIAFADGPFDVVKTDSDGTLGYPLPFAHRWHVVLLLLCLQYKDAESVATHISFKNFLILLLNSMYCHCCCEMRAATEYNRRPKTRVLNWPPATQQNTACTHGIAVSCSDSSDFAQIQCAVTWVQGRIEYFFSRASVCSDTRPDKHVGFQLHNELLQ